MTPGSMPSAEMTLNADLCVIGAGPAGLSLAQALAGSGLRVVVLESGAERTVRQLTDIQVEGENPYPQSDIGQTRAAALGGTSGLWSYRMSNQEPETGPRGCRYAPLDEIDFEPRPGIPHTGWPFGRAELDPWYAAAQPVCGLGRFDYTGPGWARPDSPMLPVDPDLVQTQMFQFGPASAWTAGAVARIRADPALLIVTDANATALEVDETAGDELTIARVGFTRPDGQRGLVEARAVVLAAGGIENSRLLLLAGEGIRGGMGNRHDQVGRYWMEHPQVRGGLLVVPPGVALGARLSLYDADFRQGTKVMGKLTIAPGTARARDLISASALLLPRHDVLASPAVQAYTALRSPTGRSGSRASQVAQAFRMAIGVPDLLTARRVMARHIGVDHNGWASQPETLRGNVFELLHQTEQTPHPENRIRLGADRDQYGRRIPVLNWHWSADDRIRITRSRDLFAVAFRKAGLGDVIQGDWDHGQPRMVGGNHHHMGGTRISPSSHTGVVDADLRVHGTQNLFVAGSSVFPAGGSVNPTLTIVALSLRLAAHLRETLTRSQPRTAGSPGKQGRAARSR